MAKFFDIKEMMAKPELKGEESGLKTKQSNSKSLRVKFEAMHEQKITSLKMLCGRLPEENEIFFLETQNSFNTFTFIVYLLKHAGRIDRLLIKTYSINTRILESLSSRIRKNEIGEVCLYIAESIRYRMPKVKDQLDIMQKEMENFQVEYSWTHQKVMTAKIGNDCYIVEGSGNFSENSAEEQYIFMRSERIYEFRTGHIN